jgi:hypothetical protein
MTSPIHEQMVHLCTIMPFETPWNQNFEETVECSVSLSPRFREIRFVSASGTTKIMSLDPSQATTEASWTLLLEFPYCKLTALMVHSTSASNVISLEPVAIRIALVKERIKTSFDASSFCDNNFLSFERLLQTILLHVPYLIDAEGSPKRRKSIWDLNPKTIEIRSLMPIMDHISYSFEDLLFVSSEQVTTPVKLQVRPTILVSGASNSWQEVVLSQASNVLGLLSTKRQRTTDTDPFSELLLAHNSILIVTTQIAIWASVCEGLDLTYCIAHERGVFTRQLPTTTVILANPKVLSANLLQESILLDTINEATAIVSIARRLPSLQAKRLLTKTFAKAYTNFTVPLQLIQFGLCILDDIEALHSESVLDANVLSDKHAMRWIQICVDKKTTKPSSMNAKLTPLVIRSELTHQSVPFWTYPHITSALSNIINVIPMSKTILKRYKVFGHIIKYGPIEERISKVFASKYCPISNADAIERFSGAPMPLSSVRRLIETHFQRLLVSLGQFLMPPAQEQSALSLTYLRTELDSAEPKKCLICFSPVDELYCMTICGHVYCGECSRYHFMNEWNNFKAKECASCRCPCVQGDVFHVAKNEDSYKIPEATKDASISQFLSGFRTMNNVVHWSAQTRFDQSVKHLIVKEIVNVEAVDIIKSLASQTSSSTNIHVFYLPNEYPWFYRFTQCF